MTHYLRVKPAPRLLSPQGWVEHGYMDQETLDAVLEWCQKQREQAAREARQETTGEHN